MLLCKCLSKVRSQALNLDLTLTPPILTWWSVKGLWNPSCNQSRGYQRTFQSTVSPGTYCCAFGSISLVGAKSANKYFCLLSLESPQRGNKMCPQRLEKTSHPSLVWNKWEWAVGWVTVEKGLTGNSGKDRVSMRVELVGDGTFLWSVLFLSCVCSCAWSCWNVPKNRGDVGPQATLTFCVYKLTSSV